MTTGSRPDARFSTDGRYLAFLTTGRNGKAEVVIAEVAAPAEQRRFPASGAASLMWNSRGQILVVATTGDITTFDPEQGVADRLTVAGGVGSSVAVVP